MLLGALRDGVESLGLLYFLILQSEKAFDFLAMESYVACIRSFLQTKNATDLTKATWEGALGKRLQDLHHDWITRDEGF
jgi:hypothetical protein